jgi:pyruvate dehydrogenase E1 component beta subunit
MRVIENLNRGLDRLLADYPDAHLLGEDIVDPYGGAFKATRGLSTRYPDRVLATPLSEAAIVGVANGLALAGMPAVAEIMFADFVTLAFDQIVNFASKSVSMYGTRRLMPLIVRCPTGGGRGYGPTHSQSLLKHFIGVPGLAVYELSPFCDAGDLLAAMVAAGEPAMLFEDKLLYSSQVFTGGAVDEVFRFDLLADGTARVYADNPEAPDCLLVAPGGLAHRALRAARNLLIEHELSCLILLPTRLYPFDVEPLGPALRTARAICVAEESTTGGTWGAEVARLVYQRFWQRLRGPVRLVHSADSVIPCAAHLEEQVLVRAKDIEQAVLEALA